MKETTNLKQYFWNPKDSSYKGPKLTSTSSSYIASKAKELCQEEETKLKNLTFYSTSINLIGTVPDSVIDRGTESIDWIPASIERIAKTNSLIAWLREAIKERDRMLEKVKRIQVEEFCELKGIEFPERPGFAHSLTEEEYYDSLSIKEKNRYYSLQAAAAVYGKVIHLDGSLNKGRKKLMNVIQKPYSVDGTGRDATIYSYVPTVELSDVDELFFKLQEKHREIQAELNSIKYECEKAMKASEIEATQLDNKLHSEYMERISDIRNKMQLYIAEQTKVIGDLKIIIPNDLMDIYNEVKGK